MFCLMTTRALLSRAPYQKAFRQLLLLATLFSLVLSPLAQARSQFTPATRAELEKSHQAINRAIKANYNTKMKRYFVRLAKLAKKHKTAAQFSTELLGLEGHSAEATSLRKVLKGVQSPRILTIKDGVRLLIEGKYFDVKMGDKMGEVRLNGKPVPLTSRQELLKKIHQGLESKTSAQGDLAKFFSQLHQLIFPQAQAFAFLALVPVLKAVGGLVAWSAGMSAATYGISSALGCGVGIAAKLNDKTYLEGCKEGYNSITNDRLMSELVPTVGGVAGAYIHSTSIWMFDVPWQVKEKIVGGLKFIAKKAGIVAAGLVALKGAAVLAKMNGTLVECDYSSSGGYRLSSLQSGGIKEVIYSYDEGVFEIKDQKIPRSTLVKQMTDYLNKENSSPELIKKAKDQLGEQHDGFAKRCRDNPGEDFKLMFSEAKTQHQQAGGLPEFPMSEATF